MPGSALLLLHGFHGSGVGHWQSHLVRRMRREGVPVLFPGLPDPDDPEPGPWAETLHTSLAELAELAPREGRVVACHSLGSILWMRRAPSIPAEHRVARVALVAPPSPSREWSQLDPFFEFEVDRGAVAAAAGMTRVVCSDADPWSGDHDTLAMWAQPLGLPVDLLPGAGHISEDAGFGKWPAIAEWVLGERVTLT